MMNPNSKDKKTVGYFQKLTTWIFVLSPILQTYGWGKYDFAFILTSLVGIWALIQSKLYFKYLPQYLLFYFVYWLLIHFVSSTSMVEAMPLGVVKTILVYGAFFSVLKLPLLIKYYRIVVRICILYFFIQIIFRIATGVNLPGVFTFLPFALNTDASDYYASMLYVERVSAFFSEPALFVQYTLPYLCLLLFDNNSQNQKQKVESFIVMAALLLTQSGNALLGLVVVCFVYFMYQMKGSAIKKWKTIFIVIVFAIGAGVFSRTDMGQKLMSRQDQVHINSVDDLGYSTSGFERVFRGYYFYAEYSTLCKIIGNDNQEYKKVSAEKSKVSTFVGEDYLYYNTIQGYLLNTGIIGLVIMFFVYKNIWIKTDRCGKCIMATFIALNFISSAYFTEIMCLYLLLPTLLGRYQLTQKSIVLNNNAK